MWWSPSTETGVVGYNLFRAGPGAGPFVKLNAQPMVQTSYMDQNVQRGRTYRYYVTVVIHTVACGDQESRPSTTPPITLPVLGS